ncbi:MAG: FAD-dependent oxidoreductase [Clostridiales bacterium]|nr:FAD-dependent oxidoreductase [Clostridiales bacterium]
MTKPGYRFLIIGAGVSGLTTAHALSREFPGEVLVLEKEPEVGGLLRTIQRNSARYDLGSHRIHKAPSEPAFRLIQEVCQDRLVKNERGGKLRLRKSYIDYPITSFQMFRGLGLLESGLCAVSLLRHRLIASLKDKSGLTENDNYESYLMRRAGKRAYRLFYEPYARKVWGGEPSQISTTAVKKRISMLSPTLFLKDMVGHYTGRSKNSFYYYLKGGISGLVESLARRVRENGGEIVTDVGDFFLSIEPGAKVCRFRADCPQTVRFDTLITTIPLDESLMKLAPPAHILRQIKDIKWRGLRLVFLHVQGEPLLEGESFYFPELKYIFGRVSVPKRFDPAMQPAAGETAITCEVPCSEADNLWTASDREMFDVCLASLRRAGLVTGRQKALTEKNFIINLPKIYPVYRVGWEALVKGLLLDSARRFPFVYFSGKPGLFLHNNIDQSMEIGLMLAEDILRGKAPQEWLGRLDSFHNMKLRD